MWMEAAGVRRPRQCNWTATAGCIPPDNHAATDLYPVAVRHAPPKQLDADRGEFPRRAGYRVSSQIVHLNTSCVGTGLQESSKQPQGAAGIDLTNGLAARSRDVRDRGDTLGAVKPLCIRGSGTTDRRFTS